jgi:hypothetical protein
MSGQNDRCPHVHNDLRCDLDDGHCGEHLDTQLGLAWSYTIDESCHEYFKAHGVHVESVPSVYLPMDYGLPATYKGFPIEIESHEIEPAEKKIKFREWL